MASADLTLACESCGRPAIHFHLRLGEPKNTGPLGRRDRLERLGFMGTVTKFGAWKDLEEFFNAIARRDFEAALIADPDFVAFYCRLCAKVYCEQCWRYPHIVFDEGFYDCTYATCPAGHEQVIDD